MLGSVLERATPPKAEAPAPADEVRDVGTSDAAEPAGTKGRGAPAPRSAKAEKAKRGVKARTVYLPDDLFERILVQSHRRSKTISEYVTSILERQVPDHRRVGPAADSVEAERER